MTKQDVQFIVMFTLAIVALLMSGVAIVLAVLAL